MITFIDYISLRNNLEISVFNKQFEEYAVKKKYTIICAVF